MFEAARFGDEISHTSALGGSPPPPNGTLTDIKRVVNNKAVETLTQYQLLAR
ncbi:hypothetical protein [Pseudomonas putida]|uniref:hypothetical protein n=1 Tax=Pseudomonas putida TaxID=303 RepID=UPI0015E1B333|nr:hypothetical protein [Pseudomonas putida]